MASIFDLASTTEELSSKNGGLSKMQYNQLPPSRDVSGVGFYSGQIPFRWENSGTKWWVPSKAYAAMRIETAIPAGKSAADCAPSMNYMSNLFKDCEYRLGNKTVSRVSSHLPQISALNNRLDKSSSWLKNQGAVTNFTQGSFVSRLKQVTNGSYEDEVVNLNFEGLGLTAGATVAYTSASGLMTFSVDHGLLVGDVITLTSLLPTSEERQFYIHVVTSNTVVGVELGNGIDLAAEVNAALTIQCRRTIKRYTAGAAIFEITWQPPLSIFQVDHAIPAGNHELVFTPHTKAEIGKRVMESNDADKVIDVDFTFNVDSMYLYYPTVEGPRMDDGSYILDLSETRCQSQLLTGPNTYGQTTFDVSPSTYALTVAYQHQNIDNTTVNPASKFTVKIAAGLKDEHKLERFMISYSGEQKPSPDADVKYKRGERNYLVRRYLETQLNSGAYFDNGGAESFEEYLDRGMYMYYAFPRDGSDRSTRVQVNQKFDTAGADINVLLFDHYKQMVQVIIKNGRVISVQAEEN